MDSASNALEIIKNYRVPDLQALLEYARLSRQGNKRELFQRCKTLISSSLTPRLINKINQINQARINSSKTPYSSVSLPLPSTPNNQQSKTHSNNLNPTSSNDNLPLPNQIQYVQLPFYDKLRTIECVNVVVDSNSFSPLRFILTEFDVDFILRGLAKIFLRIAPTIINEKQNDVAPPYLFVQCNGQSVINNNASKTVGSQAHSTAFPTDITDKIIPKSNVHNTLNYLWLQSPIKMSFKNLPKSYTMTVQLVRYITLDSLFNNILKREPQLKNSDNNDSDIEIEDLGLMTTRHRVSLICPITQSLIVMPTKSSSCSHLTCFDLRAFLQMNEKRVQWTCPICKKSATYDTLCVDKRLQSILSNVPLNCSTVEIDSSSKNLTDCHYILDNPKEEKSDIIVSNKIKSLNNSPNKSRRSSTTSDCIVLTSGSESEDEKNSNIQTIDSSVPTISQSNTIASFRSLMNSSVDDENYWNNIARIAFDLITDNNEQEQNRKRTNSSTSSSLLSNVDNQQNRKRLKRLSNNDIDVITLSSNDSSDIEDLLL